MTKNRDGMTRVIAILAAYFPLLTAELLPIKTYTTADGLAADRVDNIVADSRGFLWFCTRDGLSRFDGSRFVTYGLVEGLPNQAVLALAEAASGDHWIGTAHGLSKISAGNGAARFTNYRLGQDDRSNYVGALRQMRSGKMVAGTGTGIVEWTDPLQIRPRVFPKPP